MKMNALMVAITTTCIGAVGCDGTAMFVLAARDMKVLTGKSMPWLDGWAMVCTGYKKARVVLPDGISRDFSFAPWHFSFPSFHPATGSFAYESFNPECEPSDLEAQLRVCTGLGAHSKTLFSLPQGRQFASISISRDGDKVAFRIPHGNDHWATQGRLYVATLTQTRDALAHLRDCGVIHLGSRTAGILAWGADGNSIFWMAENGRIGELSLTSKKKSYHTLPRSRKQRRPGECRNTLLSVTGEAFLLGRFWGGDPDGGAGLTVFSVPRGGGPERVVAEFGGVDSADGITYALTVPGTKVLALTLSMTMHSRLSYTVTVFVDTATGEVLGRTDFGVVGFVRAKAVSSVSTAVDQRP